MMNLVNVEKIVSETGIATLRASANGRQWYLHSQYNPEQETQRWLDSARSQLQFPLLVLGAGLGYGLELLNREYRGEIIWAVERVCGDYTQLPADRPAGQ